MILYHRRLSNLINVLTECQQSEVQSRLFEPLSRDSNVREGRQGRYQESSSRALHWTGWLFQWYIHLCILLTCARARLSSSGLHEFIEFRDWPDRCGDWVQVNALFARLTSANIIDFSSHAVHCLNSLLDSPKERRHLFVSAAAQHLIISSTQLFTYCKITDSLTLWNKWLQTFSSAAKDSTLGNSERGLARSAAEIMKYPCSCYGEWKLTWGGLVFQNPRAKASGKAYPGRALLKPFWSSELRGSYTFSPLVNLPVEGFPVNCLVWKDLGRVILARFNREMKTYGEWCVGCAYFELILTELMN